MLKDYVWKYVGEGSEHIGWYLFRNMVEFSSEIRFQKPGVCCTFLLTI